MGEYDTLGLSVKIRGLQKGRETEKNNFIGE